MIVASLVATAGSTLAAEEASAEPTQTTSGAIIALSADALAVVLIVLIAAAVISLAMVLWFNRDALQQYYTAAAELGAKGIIATPEQVAGVEDLGQAAPDDGTTAAEPVTVEGPTAAEVGAAVEFTASRAVTWTVAPAAAAAVVPTEGTKTKMTPSTTGVVTLKATPGQGGAVERQVAVVSRKQEIKLPFVGRGYGTIAIGVLAVFAVLALGLSGRLGGEALATFFGGLLGVGAARVASGTGSKSEEGSNSEA
jgi:hypothetical protein